MRRLELPNPTSQGEVSGSAIFRPQEVPVGELNDSLKSCDMPSSSRGHPISLDIASTFRRQDNFARRNRNDLDLERDPTKLSLIFPGKTR